MALKYGATGGAADFKNCPSGSHIAICNLVADLGVQQTGGKYPKLRPQVYLRFEVPNERVEYEKDGVEHNGPIAIGMTLTASMNEKAILRKMLENWRGRKFTDAEAEDFDILAVLGACCMLSVVEEEGSGGKVYANIKNVGAFPKGMPKPVPENPLLKYTPDDGAQFDLLPEWIRKKIEGQMQPPKKPAVPEDDFKDDEIPF